MTVYYKMRHILLQNETAILLQNATEVYYKMRQDLYYKMRQLLKAATILLQMRQLLQNGIFITNCGSTMYKIDKLKFVGFVRRKCTIIIRY